MSPDNAQEANRLRGLPIDTKQQAQEFVAAYRAWVDAIATYGNGVFPVSKRPACVTHADIFRKAMRAYIAAEACYWQMPFDHPQNKAAGIPRSTWERARLSRGLSVLAME